MTTPEDRGPSSLRVVKYDPTNIIHRELVERQHPNFGTPVNSHIDARTDKITMPVAPGMEAEPPLNAERLASKQSNSENAKDVFPPELRIKLPKQKPLQKVETRRSAIRETPAKKTGGYAAFLKNQNKPTQ